MSSIRRIHAPLLSPEDVIPHLGAAHHWKDGRSAKSLVDQWWTANDIPRSVRHILDQAEEWRDAELLDAFVERSTNLNDGRPSHSQSDLAAILGIGDRLGILVIEAKVTEGFDRTVGEWLGDGSAGKKARLEGLCSLFGLHPAAVANLRYQLFHRTASAIIEARRYRATQAAMIVQSWSADAVGFGDFRKFFAALGLVGLEMGSISRRLVVNGIGLHVGWSAEVGGRSASPSLQAIVQQALLIEHSAQHG